MLEEQEKEILMKDLAMGKLMLMRVGLEENLDKLSDEEVEEIATIPWSMLDKTLKQKVAELANMENIFIEEM